MSSSRNTVVLAVLRESKFPFFLSQSALNDSGSNPSMRCVLPTWIAASFCLVPLERHSLLNFAPCAGGVFMLLCISLRRLRQWINLCRDVVMSCFFWIPKVLLSLVYVPLCLLDEFWCGRCLGESKCILSSKSMLQFRISTATSLIAHSHIQLKLGADCLAERLDKLWPQVASRYAQRLRLAQLVDQIFTSQVFGSQNSAGWWHHRLRYYWSGSVSLHQPDAYLYLLLARRKGWCTHQVWNSREITRSYKIWQ